MTHHSHALSCIYLLELVIGHNRSTHEHNMRNMDDITPTCDKFSRLFRSWMSDRLISYDLFSLFPCIGSSEVVIRCQSVKTWVFA